MTHELTLALHALIFNALYASSAPILARALQSYCDYHATATISMTTKELRKHYHATKLDLENHFTLAVATLISQKLIKAVWNDAEQEAVYKCIASFEQFKTEHKELTGKGGK